MIKQRNSRPANDMVFGMRAVIEAIDAGKTIDKILLKKDLTGELSKELLSKIKERRLVSQRVPVEKLNRITTKNHQGVVAFISPVTYYKADDLIPTLYEDGKVPLILVLDGITDTRNFGALARTADCAGVDAIIIPERNSVSVTPEAIKTSAGALFHIPVCRERNLADAVRTLQENGVKIMGASEKSSALYTDVDYTVPVAIVMGAEDTGISETVLNVCDDLAAIPMFGNVASLNVSVAGGIVMYEAVRQRLAAGLGR